MDKESILIRLETSWIRTRAWISTLVRLGAISMILLGVLAIWTTKRPIPFGGTTRFMGYDVPGLLGFTPHETLFWAGVLALMLGVGFSYRWTIKGTSDPMHV